MHLFIIKMPFLQCQGNIFIKFFKLKKQRLIRSNTNLRTKHLAHIEDFSTFASLQTTKGSRKKNNDSVAQLVEQYTFNVWVLGSNPSRVTKKSNSFGVAFFCARWDSNIVPKAPILGSIRRRFRARAWGLWG
jgi:hypothetical protein